MKKNLKDIFLLILFLLCLLSLTACFKPSEEKIKAKMEEHLLTKYGEPFVVQNIGIRNANGQKFYTARIYPKSIVGTPKEFDNYYYATVNIDILANGKLRKTGDTYGEVNTKEEAENYLLPKAKELFGERIRLKTEPELEEKDDKDGLWYGYITPNFRYARNKVIENPEKYRLKMSLYIYIFDKIDNEEEKEERRKQLFEFLQYLRVEGLDRYLAIDCNFMDDIVLAPSFEENRYLLESDTNKGEKLELIEKLREEVKKLDKKSFLSNMEKIKKSELKVENGTIGVNFLISYLQILSINYLKDIDVYGRYEERIKDNRLENHYYKNDKNIDYSEWDEYVLRKDRN